jgi:hypothetical protein
MIRLLVAVALFLALHPAARALPRHEQAALAAAAAPHARLALPVVNGLGAALPSRFTRLAPPAHWVAAGPARVAACASRRPAWSARLLL